MFTKFILLLANAAASTYSTHHFNLLGIHIDFIQEIISKRNLCFSLQHDVEFYVTRLTRLIASSGRLKACHIYV